MAQRIAAGHGRVQRSDLLHGRSHHEADHQQDVYSARPTQGKHRVLVYFRSSTGRRTHPPCSQPPRRRWQPAARTSSTSSGSSVCIAGHTRPPPPSRARRQEHSTEAPLSNSKGRHERRSLRTYVRCARTRSRAPHARGGSRAGVNRAPRSPPRHGVRLLSLCVDHPLADAVAAHVSFATVRRGGQSPARHPTCV
jgi:hypothetical protein